MRQMLFTFALTATFTLAALPVTAQESGADAAAAGGNPRATFDAEICTVDGLTPSRCECAWKLISARLSPADLKLALLLTASNSENPETAKRADEALNKSNASDKRQDALSSEMSSLVIDVEDACP